MGLRPSYGWGGMAESTSELCKGETTGTGDSGRNQFVSGLRVAGAGDWKRKGLMGLLEKREQMVWLGRVTGAVRDVCAAWETVRDRILRFRLSLSETEGKGNVFQKNVGSWQCRDVSAPGEGICLEERKAKSRRRGQSHTRHPT